MCRSEEEAKFGIRSKLAGSRRDVKVYVDQGKVAGNERL